VSRILVALPVFAPSDELLTRNLNGLQSLKHLNDMPADVAVGGWTASNAYWNQIAERYNEFSVAGDTLQFIGLHQNAQNYGKAYTINQLVKNAVASRGSNYYDFLLTADSDIEFLPQPHFIERLCECARVIEGHKGLSFGVLGLNQTAANCNDTEHMPLTHTYKNSFGMDELVRWSKVPAYIAGGCLFTSMKAWLSIGGYRVMGVYAGDEAWYLSDCSRLHYSWQMIETAFVNHPPEGDASYVNWKHKVCARDSDGKVRADLTQQIEEANAFWKNK